MAEDDDDEVIPLKKPSDPKPDGDSDDEVIPLKKPSDPKPEDGDSDDEVIPLRRENHEGSETRLAEVRKADDGSSKKENEEEAAPEKPQWDEERLEWERKERLEEADKIKASGIEKFKEEDYFSAKCLW